LPKSDFTWRDILECPRLYSPRRRLTAARLQLDYRLAAVATVYGERHVATTGT
jgi:hypothetical protein